MKYLEAKKLRESRSQPEENKMQSGSLPTQQTITPDILAKQLGVNLATVVGTGLNGEVLNKDVREQAKKDRAKNQEHPPISTPTHPKQK